MPEILVVALGGALGSVARYGLGVLALPISRELPLGTIIINVTGSFLIAFVGTLTLANGRHPWPDLARLFVMIGFCGGFTTFSSFSLQTLDLARQGAFGRAVLNVGLSVLLCLAAVAAGHAIAARFNGEAAGIAQTPVEEEEG